MNFQNIPVLIVGDVMLDQYWFGGTSRISQEAPVPIVHLKHRDERPGGAANVSLGIKALGAKPILLGIVGEDEISDRLEALLNQQKIENHLFRTKDHPTIAKLRILSRNQQMIRLDTEQLFPKTIAHLLQAPFTQALSRAKTLVLSDYGKGTLSNCPQLIALAKKQGVTVIVDPKSNDFSHYHGADILTPNMKEFEIVAGPCNSDEMIVERARKLLSLHEIKAFVITRSERGMSIITHEQAIHLPTHAKEIFDVTGAGDTVISVLATAIASGIDWVKAAYLSNIAAGISVRKLGASTVTLPEIQSELGHAQELPIGIIDQDALLTAVQSAKAQGQRIVFTNGCFDILHAGHVMILEQARRLGDRLIVGINTDASIARLKGKNRPMNPLSERMAVLAGLRSVDWVVPFDEDTPEQLIQLINPYILAKGGDYKDIDKIPGAQFVQSQGGEVRLLGHREGVSTTRLIEHIVEQHTHELLS